MAVSFKLAGVFSLCLSPMLVAVLALPCRGKIGAPPFRIQRDGFPVMVN